MREICRPRNDRMLAIVVEARSNFRLPKRLPNAPSVWGVDGRISLSVLTQDLPLFRLQRDDLMEAEWVDRERWLRDKERPFARIDHAGLLWLLRAQRGAAYPCPAAGTAERRRGFRRAVAARRSTAWDSGASGRSRHGPGDRHQAIALGDRGRKRSNAAWPRDRGLR